MTTIPITTSNCTALLLIPAPALILTFCTFIISAQLRHTMQRHNICPASVQNGNILNCLGRRISHEAPLCPFSICYTFAYFICVALHIYLYVHVLHIHTHTHTHEYIIYIYIYTHLYITEYNKPVQHLYSILIFKLW